MASESYKPYHDYVVPLESVTRHLGEGWLRPILALLAGEGVGMSKSPTVVLTLGEGLTLHATTRGFLGLGQFEDKKTPRSFKLPHRVN